jgi:divalent metal cation (Fe/Co/Zn/Cd) transporter
MDPLAGGIVALMIVKVGAEIVSGGFRDLMDTALHQEQIDEISKILDGIPELIHHHNLRTRKIGGEILMDLHIQVDTDLTVTEGHKIAEMVRRKLIRSFQGINDVLVHVDGEDDSDVEPIYSFTRESLENSIDPILASHGNGLKRTGLRVHHLKGKNLVDLFLHGHHERTVAETEALIRELKSRLQEISGIDDVRIYLDFDLNRGQSQSQK